jgi:hypothetical protein
MQLLAWRTTGKNPCDDPPVYITIASKEPGTEVYPWVLPLARAAEMFGQGNVDQIGEEPVEVYLHLMIPATDIKAPERKI